MSPMSPKSHFIALRAKFKQPKRILLLDLYIPTSLHLYSFQPRHQLFAKEGLYRGVPYSATGTSAGGGATTVLWQVQEITRLSQPHVSTEAHCRWLV